MSATENALHRLVHKATEAYATALETTCEAALTGGICGVSVVGDITTGYTFAVDPRVPYGQVWNAPTDEALWLAVDRLPR